MENDLPPSYNSVVENQLRKRDNLTGNEETQPENDTPQAKHMQHREASKIYSTDHPRRSSLREGTPENHHEQLEQRTSLWGRVKKALEDFALFVIQVLD